MLILDRNKNKRLFQGKIDMMYVDKTNFAPASSVALHLHDTLLHNVDFGWFRKRLERWEIEEITHSIVGEFPFTYRPADLYSGESYY